MRYLSYYLKKNNGRPLIFNEAIIFPYIIRSNMTLWQHRVMARHHDYNPFCQLAHDVQKFVIFYVYTDFDWPSYYSLSRYKHEWFLLRSKMNTLRISSFRIIKCIRFSECITFNSFNFQLLTINIIYFLLFWPCRFIFHTYVIERIDSRNL